MIEYFCKFIDESKQIDEQLKVHYSKYTSKLAITNERVEELMEEMKQEELRRVATESK